MAEQRGPRVAIACQGGGSHTAFTAGALSRLLSAPELAEHRIVGLSGTSGGAICALLAWAGLRDGNRARAVALLGEFWEDNSARDPMDKLLNFWMVSAGVVQNLGLVPGISPYAIPKHLGGMDAFRDLLSRHVDFERIGVDRDRVHPMLLLGAVDVLTGRFRTFDSHRDRITADSVIASAAIPTLFRAVHVDGGTYWDGLFSQNPPVRNLMQNDPDELWVIQVNPQKVDREPRTFTEIVDRRNELAGNLSLYQELGFIETIDKLLADGRLTPSAGYRQVTVRVIEMPRSALPRYLGPASKLNRDPGFLEGLAEHGRDQADRFLSALAFERAWTARDVDAVLDSVSEEAVLVSEPPFPAWEGGGDGGGLRKFVEATFEQDIAIDLTHKQIARDRATWSIRRPDSDGPVTRGEAEVTFTGTRIDGIRMGPRREQAR